MSNDFVVGFRVLQQKSIFSYASTLVLDLIAKLLFGIIVLSARFIQMRDFTLQSQNSPAISNKGSQSPAAAELAPQHVQSLGRTPPASDRGLITRPPGVISASSSDQPDLSVVVTHTESRTFSS